MREYRKKFVKMFEKIFSFLLNLRTNIRAFYISYFLFFELLKFRFSEDQSPLSFLKDLSKNLHKKGKKLVIGDFLLVFLISSTSS